MAEADGWTSFPFLVFVRFAGFVVFQEFPQSFYQPAVSLSWVAPGSRTSRPLVVVGGWSASLALPFAGAPSEVVTSDRADGSRET